MLQSLLDQSHPHCGHKSSVSPRAEEVEDINETINLLAGALSCLNDDTTQVHSQVTRMQHQLAEQRAQVEQMRHAVQNNAGMYEALQLNEQMLQSELESARQLVEDASSRSFDDGTFTWKITDVAQKMLDAKANRTTSIYSPPFYSSPTGYKMRLRLYFNGDGQALNTHLSIFLVIFRGEYDAILTWPFNFKVTFCLFDQTVAQRHIIDSFRPDVKSTSFQRPQGLMNIASGLPRFLPLTIIQTSSNPYVKDDCMFIRCLVDFASIPKAVIPIACQVNLGLPTMVQRAKIRAEIERFNQSTAIKTEEKS